MHLEKTHINFEDLTSNVQEEQKNLINGIDINQVKDLPSLFKYFKLEILTLFFSTFLFLVCFFFREGQLFPDKEPYWVTLFIYFLLYLRHTLVFTLFQEKDENYRKVYEKVTGEKLDKTKQIKNRFGSIGLLIYLAFTATPFIMFYMLSYHS